MDQTADVREQRDGAHKKWTLWNASRERVVSTSLEDNWFDGTREKKASVSTHTHTHTTAHQPVWLRVISLSSET